MIQKAVARGALLLQHAPLAQASVHQQAKPQGQVALTLKIIDSLRPTVLLHGKIVFCQIWDDLSMFVANRCQDAYDFHFHSNLCLRSLLRRLRRLLLLSLGLPAPHGRKEKNGQEYATRAEGPLANSSI